MTSQTLSSGVAHELPADMAKVIMKHPKMEAAWQDITPLARNEFICWVEDAKKPETRARRIEIARDKLTRGERRPCCWVGCVHRTDKAMSPSQKWATNKK